MRRLGNYILNELGEPVEEPDVIAWARWYETADRHVARTEINDVLISTVFLGLDHGYDTSAPVLYETMIFGGEHDGYEERYCTREEAKAGHERAMALVCGKSHAT